MFETRPLDQVGGTVDVDHGAIHIRISKSEVAVPSNERVALVLNAAKLYDLIPGMNDLSEQKQYKRY